MIISKLQENVWVINLKNQIHANHHMKVLTDWSWWNLTKLPHENLSKRAHENLSDHMRILVSDHINILVSDHIDMKELEHNLIQMVKGLKFRMHFVNWRILLERKGKIRWLTVIFCYQALNCTWCSESD